MKEKISIVTAVIAIVISILAITSATVLRPEATTSELKLADNSVLSSKIADGTIVDSDISDTGISKLADDSVSEDQIADESITLSHLTSEVLAAMTGVVDIANNSITKEKIANGSISNRHIANIANIDPSKILGLAWTGSNDGSGSGLDADMLDGKNSDEFADSTHSHEGLLLKTTVLPVDCEVLASFSDVLKKVLDVGTFTTLGSDSLVDITFNGRIYAQSLTGTGAKFVLTVDDMTSTNGRARATLKASEVGGAGVQVSIKGIFTGLDIGSHTVNIYVQTSFGTGTNAMVDPGCWSTDHIVIMEYK